MLFSKRRIHARACAIKDSLSKENSRVALLNPNRSLDTPSPFLIGKVRLSGSLDVARYAFG